MGDSSRQLSSEAKKHPFADLMIFREVCFLPGAPIRDVTERLPNLIQFADYYPLLLFHVDNSDTDRNRLRRVKKDYRTLGEGVRDSGAQAVLSSIFLAK